MILTFQKIGFVPRFTAFAVTRDMMPQTQNQSSAVRKSFAKFLHHYRV